MSDESGRGKRTAHGFPGATVTTSLAAAGAGAAFLGGAFTYGQLRDTERAGASGAAASEFAVDARISPSKLGPESECDENGPWCDGGVVTVFVRLDEPDRVDPSSVALGAGDATVDPVRASCPGAGREWDCRVGFRRGDVLAALDHEAGDHRLRLTGTLANGRELRATVWVEVVPGEATTSTATPSGTAAVTTSGLAVPATGGIVTASTCGTATASTDGTAAPARDDGNDDRE